VDDGTTVRITETTGYPFDEVISFTFSTPAPVRFPFMLRTPNWCEKPTVSLNGNIVSLSDPAQGWIVLEHTWHDGDSVKLELPMTVKVKVWEKNKNSVSLYRGPLTYSLRIGERWEHYGGNERWPAFEVFPTTPWNYGLIVDPSNPATSFEVVRQTAQIANQPFTIDHVPIALRAKGKRIPKWTLEPNGLIGEIPESPVRTEGPVEEITLIPMGCARLRVSAFPQIAST
jgi:hypothetical protein